MEFIWMMAGSDDVHWIAQFNKGYVNYAEENGRVWGAYGHRWRNYFSTDQIARAIEMLRGDPTDRRVVLEMWDASSDLGAKRRDLPCNTHIYFRISNNALDMTVCNRSNDLIWGMLGANVVHMTLLQELIAHAVGVPVGTYRVFSNNVHVYTKLVHLLEPSGCQDEYRHVKTQALLQGKEDYEDLLYACEKFVDGNSSTIHPWWIANVAFPMMLAYLDKPHRKDHIAKITAPDWKLACEQWERRHRLEVV